MQFPSDDRPDTAPRLAWLAAALAGGGAPVAAIWLLGDAPGAGVAAPVAALGMMGAGMIGAAASGRLVLGAVLAVLSGAGLLLLAWLLRGPIAQTPALAAIALVAASISFAARGALFARSAGARGWWIAVAVVAGEAAVLITAAAMPGAWPGWVLALLPAQWATLAIHAALSGTLSSTGAALAHAAVIALGGTALATLLVARLWPRRWPYLVMFTTWIAMSALVWQRWEAAL